MLSLICKNQQEFKEYITLGAGAKEVLNNHFLHESISPICLGIIYVRETNKSLDMFCVALLVVVSMHKYELWLSCANKTHS